MASNSQFGSKESSLDIVTIQNATIRRRTSLRSRRPSSTIFTPPSPSEDTFEVNKSQHSVVGGEKDQEVEVEGTSISIQSSSKAAGQSITPYLAKYLPQTYNPINGITSKSLMTTKANTKYCNRHRPDLKCRRQADEPSMEQLQNELAALSNSDQQSISHVWSLFSAAPSKQRNLMLRGILSVCCYPQLSIISSIIRDLIKIDFISMLPPELAFRILCYLDTPSLCKAAQVCRRWRTLADDDVIWHRMCEQHIDRKCTECGWGLPLLERKRLLDEKRQIQRRASGRDLIESSPDNTPDSDSRSLIQDTSVTLIEPTSTNGTKRPCNDHNLTSEFPSKKLCTRSQDMDWSLTPPIIKRPWKEVYKARFKVGTNWKHGRCLVKVLKGHQNGVMCLQFNDNILVTGSYDTTIKIWDIKNGKEIRTLTGHTSGVRCLQFDDVRLCSGSLDRTVKMWNWQTGECFRTLEPAMGGILSLNFTPKYLCCGSMDGTIRVWNTCEKTTFSLRGHTDFVNAVKVDTPSRTVFSGSDDCTVRLWDLDTRKCLRIFKGHVGQVQQVLPLSPEFEFDEDDFTVNDNDTDTDHDDDASNISYQDSYYHPRSDVDEQRTSNPNPTGRLPSFITNSMVFPNQPSRPSPPSYMLTCGLDNTIRLWHVPSGRCLRTFFGHLEGIWALAADTLRIVSGAEDRMIKVWDLRTGKCERTFTGHTGPVTCIGLSGEKLISGGDDWEIRILEFGEDENKKWNNQKHVVA